MSVPLRRLPWIIAAIAALVVAVVAGTDDRGAVRSSPAAAVEVPPLPEGSTIAGRKGAEASAIALADALEAVPTGPDVEDICPTKRLDVSWRKPSSKYRHGAYLTPVGPAPDLDTQRANGVVLCKGSTYGFMGFEARWDDKQWSVFDVPYVGEEGKGDEQAKGAPLMRLVAGLGDIRKGSPWYGRWGRDIEPLAAYEPQQVCDPAPKAGVLVFQALLFQAFPKSRNLGISRECSIGARSEHKEGRAWDWGVAVDVPAERRAANNMISWLLATDEYGHSFAMARRLGVMYVIWDRHIWSSYAAGAGWRPYVGRSPHTDHVHLSFSRAGGLGLTSFWDGVDLDELNIHSDQFAGFPDRFPTTFFLGGPPAPAELGPAVRPFQIVRGADAPGTRSQSTGSSSSSSSRSSGPGSSSSSSTSSDPGDDDSALVPRVIDRTGSRSTTSPSDSDSNSTPTTLPGSSPTAPQQSSTTTIIGPLPLPLPTSTTKPPTTTTKPPTTTTKPPSTTTTTRRTTTTTLLPPLPTTLPPLPTTLPTLPSL